MSSLPCPLVQPNVVRLPLSNGHYLDVKRELNAGEVRRAFARTIKDGYVTGGEAARLDPEKIGITRPLEYLVGWSFCDPQGQPLPIAEGSLLGLQMPVFREVIAAIEAHDEATLAAREEEHRKNQTGASGLRAIS
jgi:hypothetical protein